jgi:uncharacterized protein involved in type VI secretion and phage assembly
LHSLRPETGSLTFDTVLHNGRATLDAAQRIYGVVPARVVKIDDQKNQRHMQSYVQIWFPWLQQDNDKKLFKPWARCTSPDAGNKDATGFKMSPNAAPLDGGEPLKVGDEVLVAFEHGDPHVPYVLGTLWNKQQVIPAPTTPADGNDCPGNNGGPTLTTPDLGGQSLGGGDSNNKIMYMKSRNGQLMVMDDDQGTIRLNDCTGNSAIQLEKDQILIIQRKDALNLHACNKITLTCENLEIHAQDEILFHADNDIVISADGNISNTIKGSTSGTANNNMTVTSKQNTAIRASGSMSVTAMSNLTVCSAQDDLKIEAGGCLSATGMGGISLGSKAKCNFEGKGIVSIATPAQAGFVAKGAFTAKGAVILLN